MVKPRMHHYVPESYQKGFLKPSSQMIAFLDMKSGKLDHTNPLNMVKERDLYTMGFPPDGRDTTFIENPLLSSVDGTYPFLLEKLRANSFSETDRRSLSVFLGYLKSRTPSYFKTIEASARDNLVRDTYSKLLNDGVKAKEATDAGFDISSVEAFSEEVAPLLSLEKDGVLSVFLAVAESSAELIFESSWEILISGEGSFITSDNPFCRIWDLHVYVGKKQRESKKYFMVPLSSELALRISAAGQMDRFSVLDKVAVDEVNEAIAYCADRWLLGSAEENLKSAHIRAAEFKKREELWERADQVLQAITGEPVQRS